MDGEAWSREAGRRLESLLVQALVLQSLCIWCSSAQSVSIAVPLVSGYAHALRVMQNVHHTFDLSLTDRWRKGKIACMIRRRGPNNVRSQLSVSTGFLLVVERNDMAVLEKYGQVTFKGRHSIAGLQFLERPGDFGTKKTTVGYEESWEEPPFSNQVPSMLLGKTNDATGSHQGEVITNFHLYVLDMFPVCLLLQVMQDTRSYHNFYSSAQTRPQTPVIDWKVSTFLAVL
ncbi:hypothetical protein BaRGS_00040105 [Batillaria attramentaria]|uniref:Uncharacterized protein n=1 Tax=Batillaria attramentaria TaxID=370345 RepID=A0ABD0J1G6_9CAEN